MKEKVIKEKIYIWGTGKIGKRFYLLAKEKYEIVCFYDNNMEMVGKFVYEKEIKKWSVKESNYRIVIASSFWKEIMIQLIGDGLIPFRDFVLPEQLLDGYGRIDYRVLYQMARCANIKEIPYNIFFSNKKLAVVYGNCQTSAITRILNIHKNFSKDYILIDIPRVCEYVTDKELLEYFINDNFFWERVDLFMYQPVSAKNRFSEILQTDVILKKLKKECKKVKLINIYFSGYFPQLISNKQKRGSELHSIEDIFVFADKYVDEMVKNNIPVEEIVEFISKETYISTSEINDLAEMSLEELERREKNIDVTISDYIRSNYKKEQLFYLNNHPNEKVLVEYTNRILEYLGYKKEDISNADYQTQCITLKGVDAPIYPAVIKAFGLKNYEKRYYPDRYIYSDLLLDFKEYIKFYIKCKW